MPNIVLLGNEAVPSTVARRIHRKAGSNITMINQSTVDIYFSYNVSDLNNTAVGEVPGGIKIGNSGGEVVITSWPALDVWVRAVSPTFLQVQP